MIAAVILVMAILCAVLKYKIILPMLVIAVIAVTVKLNQKLLRKWKNKPVEEVEKYSLKDKEVQKLSGYFVDQEEQYVSSLGNGYIMNYLVNGSLSRGFAVVSNKRVYFRGSCFSGQGKSLVRTDEERTVDIKDVTGSGFIYKRYLGILIALFMAIVTLISGVCGTAYAASVEWAETLEYQRHSKWLQENSYVAKKADKEKEIEKSIAEIEEQLEEELLKGEERALLNEWLSVEEEALQEVKQDLSEYEQSVSECSSESFRSFVLSAVSAAAAGLLLTFTISCLLIFADYLKKRKTMFQIQYAGGCIAFDVSFYAKAEIEDFQKQLRRTKDHVADTATVKTVTVNAPAEAPAQTNVPDELRKYAELLKDGLISQEEYDTMKKKLLGL